MTQVQERPADRAPAEEQVPVRVVDCDIHVNPRTGTELSEYVPEPWLGRGMRELLYSGGMLGTSVIFAPPNEGRRADAFTPTGPPGSDPAVTGRQLFDEAGVDIAIIVPLADRSSVHPEHEAATAATINNWMASTWLGAYNRHGRYRGTLRISTDPELAVAEIEKWAGHPHFVQVMLNPYVGGGFGLPAYWPVYEAAVRNRLVVCTHVTLQRPGPALMSVYGPPSYYLENHGQFPLNYAAHLTSMLCEGVFERFPDLRFTFVEGGYAWALPYIWRLDRHWRELRSEIPALRRPPSEYVREHVSFTRQPVEEPSAPRHMARIIEWFGPRTLEFATDYPHWDGDYNLSQGFGGISPEVKARILGGNAIEKYRLPATRSARHWSEF